VFGRLSVANPDKYKVRPPGWLFGLTMVLIFVAPSQYSLALDPKDGPFIAYADLCLALLVALWAGWLTVTRQWRQVTWPPLAVWALMIVAVLAGLGAENLKLAALEVIQIGLYFFGAYMLFVTVLDDPARLRAAVITLVAALGVAIIIGSGQYLQASEPADVQGTMQSRNIYSGSLALALPLLAGIVLRGTAPWWRWGAAALLLAGLLTMLSPPLPWVLLVVLLVMAVTWGQGRRRWLAALVAVAAMGLMVIVMPLNRQVARELVNPYETGPVFKIMESDLTDGSDLVIVKKQWLEWQAALNMMADNYLLGVGTGNYQLNIGRPEYFGFLPNVHKSEPDTNNLYLVVGSSMGFAGLVALVAMMGHYLRRAGRLWLGVQEPWQRALACGLYGSALAIPLANLFTSLFVRGTAILWALIYAMIWVLSGQLLPGSAVMKDKEEPDTELKEGD
jgi:hypothetical protein